MGWWVGGCVICGMFGCGSEYVCFMKCGNDITNVWVCVCVGYGWVGGFLLNVWVGWDDCVCVMEYVGGVWVQLYLNVCALAHCCVQHCHEGTSSIRSYVSSL